jgi:muramoyltetrapeptide carboxypeptidase LdcA involved in peptidoglycan recycling
MQQEATLPITDKGRLKQCHIANLSGVHGDGRQKETVSDISRSAGLKDGLKISHPRRPNSGNIVLFLETTHDKGEEVKNLLRLLQKQGKLELPRGAILSVVY